MIGPPSNSAHASDLICFSHLRWDFVFQRPNHLMSRFARTHRVFFVEEPVFDEALAAPCMRMTTPAPGLNVCVPHLPVDIGEDGAIRAQRELLEDALRERGVTPSVLWFYNPLALPLAAGLSADITVYDCMDELSAFHEAPPNLAHLESQLFEQADIVFTGGRSLWEAKRHRHPNVHAFPSSVDVAHFATARGALDDPPDQAKLGHPRLGFFGVVDERMDTDLLVSVARARPEWQLVVVGPVVKISEASLPASPNLHWLGRKSYGQLPAYLSGWDVALMPFALNPSTKFISPTKTLEYLAGGKPVVSTPVADVVTPYGDRGLVFVSDRSGFVGAIERALSSNAAERVRAADEMLRETSWDATWAAMSHLMRLELGSAAGQQLREGMSCSTI